MSQMDQQSLVGQVEASVPEQQLEGEPAARDVTEQQLEGEPAARDVTRRQLKAAHRMQKRLAAEFSEAIDGTLKQQEDMIRAGCQLAKERRLALKSVLKAVSDSSLPLEERMRVLQARFVEVLQDQLKQDQQLQSSQKEVQAGQAELARSQQKVDGLQKLARGLSTENKTLTDDMRRQKQHTDSVQALLKDIQSRIEEQQVETHKVLDHNKLLLQENVLLKSQLVSTQEALEQLRTTQQDRIAAIGEQLQQQNDAMAQASKLHEALDGLMKENEALTLKAALASTFKERNDALEKAFSEAQAQAAHHREQMAEMQDSLKRATKVLQSFEKLQKTMTDQQQVTSQLMQERQLLKEQVQLLQQQGRSQAEKLRRTQLQKQRLEGLCRALQARSGDASAGPDGLIAGEQPAEGSVAADASQGCDGDAAAAAGASTEGEAQSIDQTCEGLAHEVAGAATCSGVLEAGGQVPGGGDEAAEAGACHDVVQQVLDNILQGPTTTS